MIGNTNPIRQIAELFGSQTRMAHAIGKAQQTVAEWVSNGRVPSQHIPLIIGAAAKLTPPVQLRPDHFFGHEPVPSEQEAA